MKKFLLLFSALLLLTGCMETSTLTWLPAEPGRKSSAGNRAIWELEARNSGIFLFYWIPIYSGNSKYPNGREYDLWENHLTDWRMRYLLNSERKRLKADKVEDIQITHQSTGAFGLWIFWLRTARATGTAVKIEKKQGKKMI